MANLLPPPSLDVDSLKVMATHAERLVTLTLSGSAEMRDSSSLTDLLMHYHAEVERVGADRVDVDVRTVDFMNSSALNAFVRWFAAIKERSDSYHVRFVSDPKKRWQRGSLNALATFAVGHVTVVTV